MRAGPVLRRVFDKRHRALEKHLAAALEGDGKAVHQARVATRRLREALPVVGAGLPENDEKQVRKLRRRMRKLTCLLGAVRQCDVAIGMLEQHQTAGLVTAPAAELVHAVLQQERDAARTTLIESLDEQRVARWMHDVELFNEQLGEPHSVRHGSGGTHGSGSTDGSRVTDGSWRIVLARRLLSRSDALRVAMNDAGMLFVSERLHSVRKALKRMRYSVELAAELGGRKLDAMLAELKDGQDTLGELHDTDVLMTYVDRAKETAPPADAAVHASLESLLTRLEAERHTLHARYLTHQPQLLVLVDRIQDQVIPRFTMARATQAQAVARRKPSPREAAAG
jgi:CHAD domain-containing protein